MQGNEKFIQCLAGNCAFWSEKSAFNISQETINHLKRHNPTAYNSINVLKNII